MAIKVFMFADRCLNAAHAPVKNCEPDQAITARVATAMAPQMRFNPVEPLAGIPGKISGYEK